MKVNNIQTKRRGMYMFFKKANRIKELEEQSPVKPKNSIADINNDNSSANIKGKYILLKYVDNTLEGSTFPNYFTYTYNLDTEKCMSEFWEEGLIKYASPQKSLSHLTVQKLKSLLKSFNLSTSGKKDDLIERIVNNIVEKDLQPHLDKYIVVTEKGEALISKYVTDWEYENRYDNFYLIPNYEAKVESVMKGDYSVIDFDEHVAPRGEFKIAACKKFYNESTLPKDIKAIIIIKFFDNPRYETIKKSIYYYLDYDIDFAVVAKAAIWLRSYSNLLSEQESKIELKYIIHNSNDSTVCEHCKSMDGKTFDISEAVIGENYPPFKNCTCDFCRCYASYDLKDI